MTNCDGVLFLARLTHVYAVFCDQRIAYHLKRPLSLISYGDMDYSAFESSQDKQTVVTRKYSWGQSSYCSLPLTPTFKHIPIRINWDPRPILKNTESASSYSVLQPNLIWGYDSASNGAHSKNVSPSIFTAKFMWIPIRHAKPCVRFFYLSVKDSRTSQYTTLYSTIHYSKATPSRPIRALF